MSRGKILIIEDNEDLVFTLSKVLKKEKYDVYTANTGEKGLDILRKELIDLIMLDLKLPKMNGLDVLTQIKEIDPDCVVLMMTASTDAAPAIEAMKKGAYDYLVKPFELEEVRLVINKAFENHELKREVARLRHEHETDYPHDKLYGESDALKDVRHLIDVIAKTPRTSVLVQGESGTGKELVANAVHYQSDRSKNPFIKINCSAIPDNLLESELFGHEKGAFTDAKVLKKGLFEMANAGTIFLDEISSMKLSLQPKILRVLETHSFRRIGGIDDIKIDVRVIAASNVDLADMVKKQEFREDLFYRLKVMEIKLAPLRERLDDVLLLAKLFLEDFNKEFNRNIQKFDPKTEKLLESYAWPGNVRELKNVIERGVILCQDSVIQPEHLPLELRQPQEEREVETHSMGKISIQEMEKYHILDVLKQVHGNKSQAARILDISRSTLREKLKTYNIEE